MSKTEHRAKRNKAIDVTLIILLFLMVVFKVKDICQWEELSDDDGFTVMMGVYEGDDVIVTDDGNEWIYECDIEPDTRVVVTFETYNEPVESWDIVNVTEL